MAKRAGEEEAHLTWASLERGRAPLATGVGVAAYGVVAATATGALATTTVCQVLPAAAAPINIRRERTQVAECLPRHSVTRELRRFL